MSRWMKFLGVSRNGDSHKGFTLTEILIALAVVGIIAVLILPVITSRAQNRGFSLSYDAEVREIMNSLEGLTLNENVKSFDKTIMNVDSVRDAASVGGERSTANEIRNVEGTAGQFLRKYTKVAKYCGATSVGCFAQTYFKYNDRNREGFILENIISGREQYTVTVDDVETSLDFSHMACAILKNGMSLCISPQVRNPVTGDLRRPVRGFIDLNGPKEPNVLGRDLRSFSMDLATRTITAPEASNVIIPLTPPVCQDGECCEEKFANGELAKRDLSAPIDACCPTLIASQGLSAVLPYCCSISDTSPECCNYMKGKVNVDELPAACKPELERTPCEKLALGDASQLAACCDDKSNQYWKEDGHDWDQTCCPLQDDKCCGDKNSKIWTAQNPWAASCCQKDSDDPLCKAECSADKWTDECCETVDSGSSIWRENCCSLDKNKDNTNCCKSDGLNVNNKFRTACCLNKDGIDKLGQTRNIECCYKNHWEDDCCTVGANANRKDSKWQNNCCKKTQYENDAACCRSDGKNGRGNPSQVCCSLVSDKSSSTYSANCCQFLDKSSNEYKDYCCESNITYAAEHACCNIHRIGCPPTCEDSDYFNSNLEQCCANVSGNDSRCCLNGKDKYGQGGYTDFCCKRATGNNAKKECCNRKLLSKDVCCTEPVKSIQNGYECTEPLSCENIYEDYKKVKKGELSPTSSRGKEVKQYWTENSCCDLTQYKNDPIVCPQPPQNPCPNGDSILSIWPRNPKLSNADIYFEGTNFPDKYRNKNIKITLTKVSYRIIELDDNGVCVRSSDEKFKYDLEFHANVDEHGHFGVGYNFDEEGKTANSRIEVLGVSSRPGRLVFMYIDDEINDIPCFRTDLEFHYSCPEPSTQCTPNNITLHSRQLGAICQAFGRQEKFWIESDREVDQEIRVKLQYYYQHLDSSSGTALSDNIEGIVYKEDLVIPKGQKKSAETDVIESHVCASYGGECVCATPGDNGYGYVFGAKIMYSNSAGIDEKCYPLNSNPDSACPNSYQTLDATWACCLQWGESAVKNSHNDGTIKTCCDYPDIAEQWASCKNSCTPNSVTLNIEPTESCAHTWYFKVKPPLTGTHQNSIPTYSYNITNHTESGVCKGTPSVEFEYIDVYSHTCGCTSGNPVGNPVSCKYCSNPNSKDCKDMTSPATCQNSYDAMCPGRDPFSTSNCSYGRYYDQYSHPMRTIAHVMTTVNGVKREVKKFESSSSQGNAYYQYDFEGGIQNLTLSFKSAAPVTEDVTIKVEYYIVHYNNDGSFNRKEGPKSQTFKIQKNKTESNKVTLSQDWTKQIVDLQVVSSEDPCYPVSNTWTNQATPPGAEPDPTCSYTSFDGPEDGCCLTAPSHNDAWYSGCCSTDTTDDDCCTAKVNKDGLKPGDFCCSSNKYKNDPRCQTPCDKVQKGTATEADKKACCQEGNNSIWTTNEAWADACCTLTDDNGYYLYRRDNSKAAMCCSAWVDSQMIKYNPSDYNSSDGKSGGCPRFDEDCIKEHFGKADISACTLSCYDDKGNPDSQYIHPFCCNLWKTNGKLNNDVKGACCTALQEHDPVWKDFCTPQEQTCPPISEANANNASAKCCSEWLLPNPMFDVGPNSPYKSQVTACCNNSEWVNSAFTTSGYCCNFASHSSAYYQNHCGGGGDTPTPSGNSCNNTIKIRCGAFQKNGNEYSPTTGQYGVIGCLITQTDTKCYPKISDVHVILHQGSSNVNHSLPIGVEYAFKKTGAFVYGMYNGEKCIFSFSGSSSGKSVNMTQQQEAPPLYGCDYSYSSK